MLAFYIEQVEIKLCKMFLPKQLYLLELSSSYTKCLCQKFVMPTFNSSTVFLQFLVLIAMVLVEGCFCSTQFQFIDFMDKDHTCLLPLNSTTQFLHFIHQPIQRTLHCKPSLHNVWDQIQKTTLLLLLLSRLGKELPTAADDNLWNVLFVMEL